MMSTKFARICLFVICLFAVACASPVQEMIVEEPVSVEAETVLKEEVAVEEAVVEVEKEVEVIVEPSDDEPSADSDIDDDSAELVDTVEDTVEIEDFVEDSVDLSVPEAEMGSIVSVGKGGGEAFGGGGGGGGGDEIAMVRPRPEAPREGGDVPDEPDESDESEPSMPQLQSGLLTAGDIDDNLNIDSFTEYINNFAQDNRGYPFLAVGERIEVIVVDEDERPVKHAEVAVGDQVVRTAADGKVYIYPELDGVAADEVTIRVTHEGETVEEVVNGGDSVQFELESTSDSSQQIDLAFIIDTTGSMGDELRYLQVEFESIVQRVQDRFPDADLHFGLTLYRDTGDRYVVRSYPFADSVSVMQGQLNAQSSSGGGDYEEAVERGLEDSLAQDWRPSATQIAFLVADAPPHNNKLDATWEYAIEARERGIIINALASSGVDEGTEYMMRSIAALTQGRHLFLTDDSGIGGEHKEPTIPCYVVTPLNDLMVRVISSQVLGERIEAVDENIVRTTGEYVNGVCQ